MATIPLAEALQILDAAKEAGKIPDEIHASRVRWVRNHAPGGQVSLPEDWATYTGQASTGPPRTSTVSEIPGAGLSLLLKIIGWATISLGCLAGIGMFVAASEYGSGISQRDALQMLFMSLVSGSLVLATAVVIDLLRQISSRVEVKA